MTGREFHMEDARLVTLVFAHPDGPQRIDVAVAVHDLDADDPMRPGDVLLWADESDGDDPGARLRVADALEAVASVLRGAR